MHRAGDSRWLGCIELVIADGSSSASTVVRWPVSCMPGGAWPGRSSVQLAAGKSTRLLQLVRLSQSEGKTNCTCKVDSQVILFDGRWPSEGGLPGSR